MTPPHNSPGELRARAIRTVLAARRDPATATGAIDRVADQFGVCPDDLRTWVEGPEITAQAASAQPADAARYSASAHFAADLDRPPRWRRS